MQLVSKISNICDHNPPALQTDGRTDRRTDGRHAIPRPRSAVCTNVHCAVKTKKHGVAVGIAIAYGRACVNCEVVRFTILELSGDSTVNDLGHISRPLDCFTLNFSKTVTYTSFRLVPHLMTLKYI